MQAGAHVLMLLTNGFEPDPRVHKEAKALREAGFSPTILCLDRELDRPPAEDIDGIRVLRVRAGHVRPGVPSSVAKGLAGFYVAAVARALRLHARTPIAAIHCHDADTLLPGFALRTALRVPLVYDIHDLYSSYFRNAALEALVQRADALCYRRVDRTIVVNDRFLTLDHLDPARATVVMNAPPRAGSRFSSETATGLFYAGDMNELRDMRYAMPVLQRFARPIEFAGDGPLLDAYKAANDRERIVFHGRIPPAEVTERTARCLAVLALYDTSIRNNRLASPNKLFEAMKFGKPAVVSADSVMADIVREHACGIAVPYGDAEALEAALRELLEPARYAAMCRNAFEAFQTRYNWETMAARLVQSYRELPARV